MHRSSRELWFSFTAIIFITILYLVMVVLTRQIPPAFEFYGHTIGVLGFILMLMTETLYTLRKRSRAARWGKMAEWLEFHIFTGLVGPYMVLLHTSWKFNGLAGLTLLLTLIIVASGFIGRYIYTAVPRGLDGAEMEVGLVEEEIRELQLELQQAVAARPAAAAVLGLAGGGAALTAEGASGFFQRPFLNVGRRIRWRIARGRLDPSARQDFDRLEALYQHQDTLRRQMASLATARRMLALWHAVHIPIGMALFTAAFIHVIASIYYATLLR
jgi:hypothetical protein